MNHLPALIEAASWDRASRKTCSNATDGLSTSLPTLRIPEGHSLGDVLLGRDRRDVVVQIDCALSAAAFGAGAPIQVRANRHPVPDANRLFGRNLLSHATSLHEKPTRCGQITQLV